MLCLATEALLRVRQSIYNLAKFGAYGKPCVASALLSVTSVEPVVSQSLVPYDRGQCVLCVTRGHCLLRSLDVEERRCFLWARVTVHAFQHP